LHRFIPTCVGNIVDNRHWIHSLSGSSPRVWGTFTKTTRKRSYIRFIPTCVGNMFDNTKHSNDATVHPHVCGEHLSSSAAWRFGAGSSPRVWGTCRASTAAISSRSVHPHVCGEHMSSINRHSVYCGSSPRVWGTYKTNISLFMF